MAGNEKYSAKVIYDLRKGVNAHGLSVIEKKKPSDRVKRTTYPEKKSFCDDIREAIDQILKEGNAKDFDELLYKLEDAEYEIKCGKHISLKGKDQKRFIRLRPL